MASQTSIKISALAICYNEAEHVANYVEQLAFADEVIFIDSYSTDDTVERAKALGVRVIQRKFDDFSTQRNFALAQATHDWVLFFDLDEEIPEALSCEIQALCLEPPVADAFEVRRRFFFFGKFLRFSGWRNDRVVRMFNKHKAQYNGDLVHEKLLVKGKTATLKNSLAHYSYTDFDRYNEKLTQYSKLQAQQLYAQGKRPTCYHFFIRPWYRFWKQYVWQGGFLDGKAGFIVSYVHAFAVFKRYLQLWMMYRKIN